MSASPALRVCTGCGFTYAEFLARGLLGCPECYANLGDALFADLLHIHPDLYRRAAGATVEELRAQLSEALRLERYEEAAAVRARLLDLGVDLHGLPARDRPQNAGQDGRRDPRA